MCFGIVRRIRDLVQMCDNDEILGLISKTNLFVHTHTNIMQYVCMYRYVHTHIYTHRRAKKNLCAHTIK